MENIYWGDSTTIKEYEKKKFQDFLLQDNLKEACHKDGKLFHIIKAEHFTKEFLDIICETAHAARKIAKTEPAFLKSLLKHKSVLNYFQQESSRTFLSFSTAESFLGMRREEVRDIKTSSTLKGESDKDSLRTISSYFDAIVCRHSSDHFDEFAVWTMRNSDREIPIINAGSGKKEHPTQALLDRYTRWESFNRNLSDKTIAYVGDCLRGRTIHSDVKTAALETGTKIYFVAPEHLQIDQETEEFLKTKNIPYEKITTGIKDVLPIADVIYMTRIQNEHGGDGHYDKHFIFTKDMLDLMKENAILMHPMPKREEIDPAIDYMKNDTRIIYWRQQRNGMWVRLALFAYVFGVDEKIREYTKIP